MLELIPIAFLAGVVSVITPCVLPLVPGYLSAVSAVERSEEHTSELQSHSEISYAVFCLKKKK